MTKNLNKELLAIWSGESQKIQQQRSGLPAQVFAASDLFVREASYYYILDAESFTIDFVHQNIELVLGMSASEFSLDKLLEIQSAADLKEMLLKEKVVADFFFNYLMPHEIPEYKSIYFLRLKDSFGKIRNILHQGRVLNCCNKNGVHQIIVTHTEIEPLNISFESTISFISTNGKRSFINLDPSSGKFEHTRSTSDPNSIRSILSSRELQVIRLLAIGMRAEEAAEILNISKSTLRTHRRNILQKSGCSNTTEVVARCLSEGLF